MAIVQIWPHFTNLTGTLIHYMESTSTARNDPLLSGPKCSICPFLIVPLITVPAKTMLFSRLYLFDIKNYECKS